MKPIRREIVEMLVVASLMSAAVAAFQVNFNVQLWVLIVMVAIAVRGYVVFEFVLSAEDREKEWLKRVGTPARLELNREGEVAALFAIAEAVKTISPGGDYTVMYYFGSEGGEESSLLREMNAIREKTLSLVLARLKLGTLREYKRIICFDHDVLANDRDLKTGVLRVGQGPGTIDRKMGEPCRLMIETKGCSLYVAPALLRSVVSLYGTDRVSVSVELAQQDTGGRLAVESTFFCDPTQRRDHRAVPTDGAPDRKTHGRSPQDSLSRGCGANGGSGSSLTCCENEPPPRHRARSLGLVSVAAIAGNEWRSPVNTATPTPTRTQTETPTPRCHNDHRRHHRHQLC